MVRKKTSLQPGKSGCCVLEQWVTVSSIQELLLSIMMGAVPLCVSSLVIITCCFL